MQNPAFPDQPALPLKFNDSETPNTSPLLEKLRRIDQGLPPSEISPVPEFPKKPPQDFVENERQLCLSSIRERIEPTLIVLEEERRSAIDARDTVRENVVVNQINRGKAGLLGKHGLEILMHREKRAKIVTVIKPEGPTCAMALWETMSPEDRDLFPIVTNSSGAGEMMNLHLWAKLFDGLSVAVIHDGDKAGQEGAKNWQEIVGPACSEFRNIKLYEETVEKNGPDLRDWINNGNTLG